MRSLIFASVFLVFSSSAALAGAKTAGPLAPDKAWLGRELTRMKMPKGFIKEALATYDKNSFKTVVTLNLLGFLQPGQHMNHVTPQSVREATKFIQENREAFDLAQEKYHVPPTVISSLLWIETRHGEDMGRFHTTSVYLHLLQSDLKKNRKELLKLAYEKNKKFQKYEREELPDIMSERTKARKQWAREQLAVLATLRKDRRLDLKTLRGSYAGAFGLPQFIPSSYKDFAKGLDPKSPPDLTEESDAIMSVAYYLSKHGWKNEDSESRVAALMKYNNSRDYADSILEISRRVSKSSGEDKTRRVSSTDEGISPTDLQPASGSSEP